MMIEGGLRAELIAGVLLDAAARGAVVFTVAAGAAWMLRRRAAAARHAVWATALALQLVMPIFGIAVPRWNVAVLPTQAAVTASSPPVSAPGPVQVAVTPAMSEMQEPASAFASVEMSRTSWYSNSMRALLALWLLGVLALVLRLVIGTIRVSRLALRAHRVTDGRWLTLASSLSNLLGIRRPLTVLRGSALSVPITWGVVYPVVLLPEDADEWPDERLRYVLVHEMAHVKRHDAMTQLIGQLALAAFWFNPLVWLAVRRVQLEREHACDDYVLRHGTKPSMYASELLELVRTMSSASSRSEAPAFAALAMARRSEFEGRMLSILDPSVDRKPINRVGVLMSISAAFLLAVPLTAFTPVAKRPTAATVPLAQPVTPKAASAVTPWPAPMAERPSAPAARPLGAQTGKCDSAPFSRAGTSAHVRIDSNRPGWREIEIARMRPGVCVEARLVGEVVVSDDETDVVDLEFGAMLFVRERVPFSDRELAIAADGRGVLQRAYKVNGATAAYDDDARQWLARILPSVLREAGVDAPKRVARLRREGGVPRVLSMIVSIQSSGAKRAHYEALLSEIGLSPEDLERVLRRARNDLSSSSGDLRAVLTKVPVRQVASRAGREALVDALSSIESDGDRTVALTQIILEADGPEVPLLATRAARTITSDGDKARLLIATADRYLGQKSESLRSAYFDVAESLESDGDKRRVLIAAATYGQSDQGVTLAVMRATTGMQSSGDQAAVLTTVASQKLLVTPALRDAYLRAADRVESEGDRSRVLRAALQP